MCLRLPPQAEARPATPQRSVPRHPVRNLRGPAIPTPRANRSRSDRTHDCCRAGAAVVCGRLSAGRASLPVQREDGCSLVMPHEPSGRGSACISLRSARLQRSRRAVDPRGGAPGCGRISSRRVEHPRLIGEWTHPGDGLGRSGVRCSLHESRGRRSFTCAAWDPGVGDSRDAGGEAARNEAYSRRTRRHRPRHNPNTAGPPPGRSGETRKTSVAGWREGNPVRHSRGKCLFGSGVQSAGCFIRSLFDGHRSGPCRHQPSTLERQVCPVLEHTALLLKNLREVLGRFDNTHLNRHLYGLMVFLTGCSARACGPSLFARRDEALPDSEVTRFSWRRRVLGTRPAWVNRRQTSKVGLSGWRKAMGNGPLGPASLDAPAVVEQPAGASASTAKPLRSGLSTEGAGCEPAGPRKVVERTGPAWVSGFEREAPARRSRFFPNRRNEAITSVRA